MLLLHRFGPIFMLISLLYFIAILCRVASVKLCRTAQRFRTQQGPQVAAIQKAAVWKGLCSLQLYFTQVELRHSMTLADIWQSDSSHNQEHQEQAQPCPLSCLSSSCYHGWEWNCVAASAEYKIRHQIHISACKTRQVFLGWIQLINLSGLYSSSALKAPSYLHARSCLFKVFKSLLWSVWAAMTRVWQHTVMLYTSQGSPILYLRLRLH